MSRDNDFEITNTKLLLQILSDDISRKDFLHARVTVKAIMDNEFDNIRRSGGEASKKVTDSLVTAVRRIEKTNATIAMEMAAYIENVAGAANPLPSKLRTAMGHKAINIANRLTKLPGATKEAFNKARSAINEVRNWTTDDVSNKADKVMTSLMNRAEKRRFKL